MPGMVLINIVREQNHEQSKRIRKKCQEEWY